MPQFSFATTSPADQAADALVLPLFEGPATGPGVKEVGKAIGADLVRVAGANDFKGKRGEVFTVPVLGDAPFATVILVGLGPKEKVDVAGLRRAAGKVARRAASYERVATTLPQAVRGGGGDAVQATVEGLLLGSYRFERYKAKDDGEGARMRSVTVLGSSRWDRRAMQRAIKRGEVLAEAAALARDLVNTPAIDATPDYLAKQARSIARREGLEVKVWTKAELEKGGFGGLLGVGSGSANQPRLIELRYKGGSGPPVALSGKGITFDSGGLSLKDAKGMEWMKGDMAGAASVIGAMQAIARLGPKVNVVAAIPSAENMPSGTAIRPGDVLRHRGGKTSEVLNTDAEGRLILADALAFLAEKKPAVIVDVATLTGACMVALGEDIVGVMANDRAVAREVLDASEATGEPAWELPLWDEYRRDIKSPIADVKNVGKRWGGAITAALFLESFVGDVPWAHLDIAGPAFSDRAGDLWPKGATGIPVRTLVAFVEGRAPRKSKR